MEYLTTRPTREEQTQYVTSTLVSRARWLARLLAKEAMGELPMNEGEVLDALIDGSRCITELAELTRFKQPTTTSLVKRLEEQGLVTKRRQTDDQRVVLVSITDAGVATLEEARARAHAALHRYLEHMSDEQVQALADAADALQDLITITETRWGGGVA